jgi:DNA-binding transcriptional LysR family regulator
VVREHAAADLSAKTLVALLEHWMPPIPGFHLYFPNRDWMPLKLRAFIDMARRR